MAGSLLRMERVKLAKDDHAFLVYIGMITIACLIPNPSTLIKLVAAIGLAIEGVILIALLFNLLSKAVVVNRDAMVHIRYWGLIIAVFVLTATVSGGHIWYPRLSSVTGAILNIIMAIWIFRHDILSFFKLYDVYA